jgi:hypothetical protein
MLSAYQVVWPLFFFFIQVLSNNSTSVQMSNAATLTNLQRGFYYCKYSEEIGFVDSAQT